MIDVILTNSQELSEEQGGEMMGNFTISWLDLMIKVHYDDEFELFNFSKDYFEPWYDINGATSEKKNHMY